MDIQALLSYLSKPMFKRRFFLAAMALFIICKAAGYVSSDLVHAKTLFIIIGFVVSLEGLFTWFKRFKRNNSSSSQPKKIIDDSKPPGFRTPFKDLFLYNLRSFKQYKGLEVCFALLVSYLSYDFFDIDISNVFIFFDFGLGYYIKEFAFLDTLAFTGLTYLYFLIIPFCFDGFKDFFKSN